MSFQITPLKPRPEVISALADLLVETVTHHGSVGFMHPLERSTAEGFWRASLASSERGERVILGAYDGKELVGTVSLLLNCPPNQAHRAELAKMMTRLSRRGQGVASALVLEAERIALEQGRTLLNLDTAEDEGAAGFYEKLGYQRTGVIPDYALKPHGGLTGTVIYWKRLG
jgi:GNAT superfamily N-acetyltransferase